MNDKEKFPIIGVCGWKGSGKTTLCVRLIEEFSQRGHKVSTMKHTDHDFHIGAENTDSEKHRNAGAYEVAVVGGRQWTLIHSLKNEEEPTFCEIVSKFSTTDIIIVEGFKKIPIPKIETFRCEQKEKKMLWKNDKSIIAIATDHEKLETSKPTFSLNAIVEIADFIEHSIGPLGRKRTHKY